MPAQVIKENHRGLFITFEGVEGAGKTTQIELLRDALQTEGHSVYVTREPGGDPVAEAIRAILLSPEHQVTPIAELLLFLAARAQVTANVIRPHLDAGQIVLCDRFIDSTVAYQGYARGHDVKMIQRLNELATGGLEPNLTILLDLDPEIGLARQLDRNRMEGESLEFHRRVREGYLTEAGKSASGFPLQTSKREQARKGLLAQARLNPSRFWIVEASRPINQIHAEILAYVRPLLPPKGKAT